jgi:hypothetical protein
MRRLQMLPGHDHWLVICDDIPNHATTNSGDGTYHDETNDIHLMGSA